MSRYTLSDDERKSTRADLDSLTALRGRARKAMEGATLSLVQRESCEKAVPVRLLVSSPVAVQAERRNCCRSRYPWILPIDNVE